MNKRITQITIGLSTLLVIGSLTAGVAFAAGPGFGSGGRFGRTGMPMISAAAIGTVSSVSGNTIMLASKNGTTYSVDASTAIVTKDGASSSISGISNGDILVVQGTVNGTSITATSIHDGVSYRNGSGIIGTVSAVSGSVITVTSKFGPGSTTSTTYTVNAGSATVTKSGSTSSVSNIAVGDTVFVQGSISGTSVTATSIRDGLMQGPKGNKPSVAPVIKGNGEPVIGGAVTVINGSQITVTNKSNVTYSVDASSATFEKNNTTSSISGVAVGDNVIVQGTVNGTSVIASSVIDSGSSTTSTGNPGNQGGFFGKVGGAIGGFFHRIFGFF